MASEELNQPSLVIDQSLEFDSQIFDNSGSKNISLIEQAKLKLKLGIKQPMSEILADNG